jgi:hypothetical protein
MMLIRTDQDPQHKFMSQISNQDNVVAKATLDHVVGFHHLGTSVLIPCHYSLQFWHGNVKKKVLYLWFSLFFLCN